MTAVLTAMASWLTRIGGALTGDVRHQYTAEYPWLGTCWCGRPEDHPLHWCAARSLSALREAGR
jgi:hypothetical protein